MFCCYATFTLSRHALNTRSPDTYYNSVLVWRESDSLDEIGLEYLSGTTQRSTDMASVTGDSQVTTPDEEITERPTDDSAQAVVATPETELEPQTSDDTEQETAVVERHHRRHYVGAEYNWMAIIWISLIHIGMLAAPFTFSWAGLGMLLFFHWLNGSIGICLGFHRLLTHGSFKTSSFVRYTLAFIGGLAGEGGAIDWVANHRKHHAHSDKDDDPHSPRDGAWWSHVFWLAYQLPSKEHQAHLKRWAPDLYKDNGMRWINALFLPTHLALGATALGIGWYLVDWKLGLSLLVWGVFLRLVLVLHTTWFVNSASHLWGYTNYNTSDDSKNLWWVAVIAYGEGWHNNHHAYPSMANHGHKWWEFDTTFWVIRIMKMTGLAWHVVDYKNRQESKPQ